MPPTCQVHRPGRKHRKESESNLPGDQDSGTGQRETIENEAEDCVVNRRPDPPVTNCSCGPEGCGLCLHTAHETNVKRPLCSDTKPVHNASYDNISIDKVQNFRLSPDSGTKASTPAQKPSLVIISINKVENLWLSPGSETSEDESAFSKCSVHKKQVECLCLRCDELICLSCRLAKHFGHRTRSINLVIEEAQQRVFDAKDRIQHDLEKQLLKAWEVNQQRRWESLAQLRHNAEGSIHKRHSQLIQLMGETFGEGDERYARVLRIIDEQRDLALRRLITMADVTSRRFQTYDDFLNEELSALSELLQCAEQSLTNIDPSQVLRVDKEIEAALSSVDIIVRRFMAMPCYTKTVKHDFARADASEMFHSSATAEEIEICVANFIGHPLTIATKVLNAFPGWQVSTDFRCCDEPETYVLSVCFYGEDKVAVSHTTSEDYSKGVVKLFNHDRHLMKPKSFGLGILVGQDIDMGQWYPYPHKKRFAFVDISVLGAAQTKYNYAEVIEKSIMFYEAQRSGKLPANNRIPWRGDSALKDKGAGGEDLTGGWYDAGDNVKFNFPMAFSTTLLCWSLLEFPQAYSKSGQLDYMYDSIRWPLEYFIKCHTKPNELYVQVGSGSKDHGSWTSPERMDPNRPAYKIDASKPGSDVAMDMAAAMACGSMAFKSKDSAFSGKLLSHAKQIYSFAKAHQGFYSTSVSDAAAYYRSQNYTDENNWGAAWMFKATNDNQYLADAKVRYAHEPAWGFSWDEKLGGNHLLMYKLTGDDTYKTDIESTMTMWSKPGGMAYTPKCLAFRLEWGPLRYSANTAFFALMAAKYGVHADSYRQWAMCQIHYALGDTGRSYVVGYGTNPPKKPHHRASSCPLLPAPCGWEAQQSTGPNPHTLYGALVGGPGKSDQYTDDRKDYVHNEVACDYNAGFQGAVAALLQLAIDHELPSASKCSSCPNP